MAYSYSNPISFYQTGNINYNENTKNPSVLPAMAGGFVLGAAAGGGISAAVNPYIHNNNEVYDTFAKETYNKYIKKGASEAEKTLDKHIKEVLKKIKKIKTADELKTLLGNNEEAKKLISADILNGVTEENLAGNKETIINSLKAKQGEKLQKIKNEIINCWDKSSKKFAKTDAVSEAQFNIIKDAAKSFKIKHIAKYAAIGGAIASVGAAIIKMLIDNKNVSKQ